MNKLFSRMVKTILLILNCLFIVNTVCFCQQLSKRDSLLKIVNSNKKDSVVANTYYKLAWTYLDDNLDSAELYIRKGGELSNKINFLSGRIKYCFNISQIYNQRRKYDESVQANKDAIALTQHYWKKDWALKAAYCNLAWAYICQEKGEDAMEAYQQSIAICEKTGDSLLMAKNLVDMVEKYALLGWQPQNAYQNSLKSIAIFKALNQKEEIPNAYFRLGTVLLDMKKYDSAMLLTQQALQTAQQYNSDLFFEGDALTIISKIVVKLGRFSELKQYTDRLCAVESKSNGNTESVHGNYYKSVYFFYKRDFDSAKKYATSVINLSRQYNEEGETLYNAYRILSEIALVKGDMTAYHSYSLGEDSVKAAVDSSILYKNGQKVEARYSLEKKQSQIENLNQEKKIQQLKLKQNNTTIIWLVAFIGLLSLSGFLYFNNTQQKRKIQQQRITELEKEKQFMAAEAVLQGQEEERTRLAKDLHDGLGGILSGVKHSFNNMKNNFIISQESVDAFDRTMVLLDRSISELRNISHNMMPEALLRFGLDTALRDYCNSINRNAGLQITYQSFELHDEDIEKSKASVIYRIIQELLNNMLKHANATTALVQLVRNNNALSITVEDNGKGFNKSEAENTEGIGMKNIKHRINYLNGQLDIQTDEGSGVSVTIEIPNIAA